MTCPFCNSKNVKAPMVDIGVGEIPCGPAECYDCGAIEIGDNAENVKWISFDERKRMINSWSLPTPWAVICPVHGQRFLTHEQYAAQLKHADERWRCPHCFRVSDWDDANYEKFQET